MRASGAKDKNGNKGQDAVAVNEANFKGSSEASLKRFTEPRRFSSCARSGLSESKREGEECINAAQVRAALQPNVLAVAFEIVTREQKRANEGSSDSLNSPRASRQTQLNVRERRKKQNRKTIISAANQTSHLIIVSCSVSLPHFAVP